MDLAQCRVVTDDVEGLAGFYARLLGSPVALNEFYVEVPTGSMTVAFSKCRFTEDHGAGCSSGLGASLGEVILDFAVADIDAEYERIDALGVEWVMPATTQPWGVRSMLFRDPEGHLLNVFSRNEVES